VVAVLLALIDEGFDRRSWHGTNLRGALRGMTPARALWRPGRTRHNIGELVTHAACWKYTVRRRLTGEKRGSFALPGSNLRGRKTGGPRPGKAGRPRSGHNRGVVRGVAAYDLYHAGQIQLIKRLMRRASSA